MILGKFAIVSTRLTAEAIEPEIASNARDVTLDTIPIMAPVAPPKPLA